MTSNPFLGVLLHATGGLAAASFYLPYRKVRRWSWESYWLVGGFFSWIIAPWVAASLLVPGFMGILREAPGQSVLWSYLFGVMWGVGGLTFGLSMRYLGMSLGYALALGLCAAFGTLIPPIFNGQIVDIIKSQPGWVVLFGVLVCLAGIAVSGAAGIAKERELSDAQKKATIREFSFVKGVLVATLAGVMSAAMAFAMAAGQPIKDITKAKLIQQGGAEFWQGLPVLIVVLLGGFTTNFVWCMMLNIRNRSGGDYIGAWDAIEPDPGPEIRNPKSETRNPDGAVAVLASRTETMPGTMLLANYVFSGLAGTIWYLQFFFYTMGETQMGNFKFSSWTLHMASIIIFSTLWGVMLMEWRGVSRRTMRLVWAGICVLVVSTMVIGAGNAWGERKKAAEQATHQKIE